MKPRLSLILALLALGIAARVAPHALSHFGISIDPGNTVYPENPLLSKHADQHGRLPAPAVQPGRPEGDGSGRASPVGLPGRVMQ